MIFGFFADIFFPPCCLACGQGVPKGTLCAPCRASITISRTLFCGQCARRLFGGKENCHPDFPYLLGSPGKYRDKALASLIHSLKFRGVRAAADSIADLLIEYAGSLGIPFHGFTVVPIPLSRERRRARGFNQSELIAKPFAERFGLPCEAACLTRVRHAKPQSETKSIAERKENIRGAFAAAHTGAVAGKNIILIDDVTTSGATFLEAARALKSKGAARIIALAAARA